MTFRKGNICRIYLENFLTYNKVQIDPKPHLNVIIGPNGTGKSTILCGICIGLGGKPDLTGRGKSLVDYIKNGEDHAKIEIELYNPDGGNYVIKREFSKSGSGSGGRSKWYLQGCETTEEKVKRLVSQLDIQVNNLCQFLPQDRVVEFAKMDKVEMLWSTEKAVGEIELSEQHKLLQDFGKNQNDIDIQLKDIKSRLKNEIRKNSQLEDQVKNIKAKEDLDKNILKLEQALLYHQYNTTRNQFKEFINRLKKLEKQLKSIETKISPNRKSIDGIKDKIKENKKNLSQKNEKLRDCVRKHNMLVNDLKSEQEKIQICKENYKCSEDSANSKERDIKEMKTKLDLLEGQLTQLPGDVNDPRKIQNLTHSISEKLNSYNQNIGSKIEELRYNLMMKQRNIDSCNVELGKIRDGKNRKLNILQSRNRNAFAANEWLKNNRNKAGLFKGVIHEPLFVSIECSNQDSKYIENVVSNQDLIAFVCENKDDVRTLKLEANKHKWPINILYSEPVDPDTHQPIRPIESLRHLGFEKYVKDTIKAPPSIINYLCRQYHIHNIPIAQKANINQIPDNINLCFIDNQRFFKRKSRYDNKISTDVSELNAPYFLIQTSDSKAEESLLNHLEKYKNDECFLSQQIKSLRENEKSYLEDVENLRKQKQEIEHRDKLRNMIKARIDVNRRQLLERENSRIDLKLEREKMNNSLLGCISKMGEICKQMSANEDNMRELNNIVFEISLRISDFLIQEKNLLKSIEIDELENNSILKEISNVKSDKNKSYECANDILNQLLLSFGVEKYTEIPESIKDEMINRIKSDTIEDLTRKKAEKEVQRSCLVVSDDTVMVEYERRKKVIENLKERKAGMEDEMQNKANNIQQIRESWLKSITQLTSQISEHFSQYMRLLGCAGEVELDTGDNENDFSNYGLSIKVQFRDTEKLTKLSVQQNSGGERSVTTALYLLALQQTPTHSVPFRCVDEINQGMDPINERKMFTMLVESMADNSAPQYFFVSPKLLQNVPYNKYVVFLNIFNWTSNVNIQSLSFSRILKRLSRRAEENKNRKRR